MSDNGHKECKGALYVISFDPLWETMKRRGATTYTLQVKGNVSSSTIRRIRENDSISTETLNKLCEVLECGIQDVIRYTADTPHEESRQK